MLMDTKIKSTLYEERGVSSDKPEVHAAIKNLSKGIFPTAFCKVHEDFAGDPNYCSILHADGAGTKSSLAYAYWKKTGDLSVWKGIAIDALVMNLDDLLCIGAAREQMFYSMTIGRNKRLVPGEVISAIIQGTQEFIEQLRMYGIKITYSGGETADVGDLVRTVIVDGTLAARMERKKVIVPAIREGDYIVGFSSTGQTAYENASNSGIGSNGLTSARHDIFSQEVAQEYPESFDTGNMSGKMYIGRYGLTDELQGTTAGKLILSPTRTYAPLVLSILDHITQREIHAVIHCSGGGQTKVLRFLPDNVRVIKNNLFPMPDLFTLIQSESKTSWQEMLDTFNCGHRLEMYFSSMDAAKTSIALAEELGIDAKLIGTVESKKKGEMPLVINCKGDTFEYML